MRIMFSRSVVSFFSDTGHLLSQHCYEITEGDRDKIARNVGKVYTWDDIGPGKIMFNLLDKAATPRQEINRAFNYPD